MPSIIREYLHVPVMINNESTFSPRKSSSKSLTSGSDLSQTEMDFNNIKMEIQKKMNLYKKQTVRRLKGKKLLNDIVPENQLFIHNFLQTVEETILQIKNENLLEIAITKEKNQQYQFQGLIRMTHHDIKQIFINFDYRELQELPKMINMGYIKTNDEVQDKPITEV